VVQLFKRTLVLAAAALLLSCGSDNTEDAPTEAPTGFTVTPGDTSVVATWNMEPGLTYWIFSAQADSITQDTYQSFPSARITQPAVSPQLITGLANDRKYSFFINATRSGSAAGPATPSVAVTPRLAGSLWTAGTPLGTDLNAIGFGAGKYITVGAGGAVFTRGSALTDSTWTAASSGVTADLRGFTVGGLILVVGDGGTIVSSSDAATWTVRTSGTSAALNGVLFGQLAYIVVGDNGTILRSNDGTTWTSVNSGTTSNLYAVGLFGSTMVAVGANGTILQSTDAGLTWAPVTSGTAATLRSVVAGGGRFVIVGDGGTILTSTDLATWTAATSPTANTLRRVVLGNQFVAVGDAGTALVSVDGVNWVATSTGTAADLRGLVRGVTLDYVTVGTGGVVLVAR
jgi:hypothetical protein